MGRYVIKRVTLAFVTTFIILSITYILCKMLPFERPIGGNDQQIAYFDKQTHLGYVARFDMETDGYGTLLYKAQTTRGYSYYYQMPILKQYKNWLMNIITKWDWGYSKFYKPNVSASVIILERIWYTVRVNIFAVIFSVPIGILLGIWAALRKNTMTDHTISTLVMVFISVPNFVMISFLMKLFCYDLKWLPSTWPLGDKVALGQRVLGYLIPVFCLSFGSICGYCRYIRAELCEILESDYLLLARTKGLTRRQAIVRHALKNAMVPIFPSILAEILGLFSGSIILEQLYCIPGIGQLFVTVLKAKDYDILFVDMAIITAVGLLSGVVLDLSYGFIDPRIRMGAKK